MFDTWYVWNMYRTHVLYDVDTYYLGTEKHKALRRYQCKVYGMVCTHVSYTPTRVIRSTWYRSRSDVVDTRRNPDIPLEFARVGFCIHFSFFPVSVGHHDAFYKKLKNVSCAHL